MPRSVFCALAVPTLVLLAACGDDDGGPGAAIDSGTTRTDSGTTAGGDSGPITGTDGGPVTGTDGGGTDGGPVTGADGSMPTTPGGIGSACTTDDDCDGDATCYTMVGAFSFPGGYCSKMCSAPADCGSGATCAGGTGFGFCAKTCTSDADCRMSEGYTCGNLGWGGGGGGMMYCLPPTSGGGWMRDGGFGGWDGRFPGF